MIYVNLRLLKAQSISFYAGIEALLHFGPFALQLFVAYAGVSAHDDEYLLDDVHMIPRFEWSPLRSHETTGLRTDWELTDIVRTTWD